MNKIICVSQVLVGWAHGDVGHWKQELLQYEDSEMEDAFGERSLDAISKGEIASRKSWNEEYMCHYFDTKGMTDQEIADRAQLIIDSKGIV